MANLVQLRQLEELHGALLVDKPEGIAFTSVVKTIKRKFNLVKVGHGGSLDAMASGLLVLLINDANKYVDQVMNADRAYEGTMNWGQSTNTGDVHGAPDGHAATESAESLRGDVFQVEPRFAAIRREGSAAYEIVDTGDHAQFLGHIYRFEVEGDRFRLLATKNVLPRAMAYDMGATLTSLRRTRQGALDVSQAVPFSRLLEIEIKDFASCVQPIAKLLR